jgi:hypothetical protein
MALSLPLTTSSGDLSLGVHLAPLAEVVSRFGAGSSQRQTLAMRLGRIWKLAQDVGFVRRFVVFGSFLSDVPAPNDVDVFLLMDDAFDSTALAGEARLLFDHTAAQSHFGASVFWLRQMAAMEGEQAAVEYWQ